MNLHLTLSVLGPPGLAVSSFKGHEGASDPSRQQVNLHLKLQRCLVKLARKDSCPVDSLFLEAPLSVVEPARLLAERALTSKDSSRSWNCPPDLKDLGGLVRIKVLYTNTYAYTYTYTNAYTYTYTAARAARRGRRAPGGLCNSNSNSNNNSNSNSNNNNSDSNSTSTSNSNSTSTSNNNNNNSNSDSNSNSNSDSNSIPSSMSLFPLSASRAFSTLRGGTLLSMQTAKLLSWRLRWHARS